MTGLVFVLEQKEPLLCKEVVKGSDAQRGPVMASSFKREADVHRMVETRNTSIDDRFYDLNTRECCFCHRPITFREFRVKPSPRGVTSFSFQAESNEMLYE